VDFNNESVSLHTDEYMEYNPKYLHTHRNVTAGSPQGQNCSKIMKPSQSLPLQMGERVLELT